MKFKKIFFTFPLLVIIALSALLTGCIDEQITDEQLTAKIGAAYEDIETYQLDMDMTVTISGQGYYGETFDTAIPIKTIYFLNIPHSKAQIEMTMITPQELQAQGLPKTMQASVFLIDNTMYIGNSQFPGGNSPVEWSKIILSQPIYEQTLASQNIVEQLSELLQDIYEIAVTDKAIESNTDCYEISLTPDIKKLFSILALMQSNGGVDFSQMDGAQIDQLISATDELSVKLWFDTGDFRPVKADLNISIEDPEENFAMSMDAELDFTNINSDMPIELPAGARNAIDLTQMITITE